MTKIRLVESRSSMRPCKRDESIVKKVKCTIVQALRLCTGRAAHRGSRGITLLFLDHGTRRGWGVSVTHRPLFTPWKDPVPILQEAGLAPGPVWTGAENLTPTGFRSPDRPARSQSLYRLRYPVHRRIYSPLLQFFLRVRLRKNNNCNCRFINSDSIWLIVPSELKLDFDVIQHSPSYDSLLNGMLMLDKLLPMGGVGKGGLEFER